MANRHASHLYVHPHPVTLLPTKTLRETFDCLWSLLPEKVRMDWLVHKLEPHEWQELRRHYEAQARRACIC